MQSLKELPLLWVCAWLHDVSTAELQHFDVFKVYESTEVQRFHCPCFHARHRIGGQKQLMCGCRQSSARIYNQKFKNACTMLLQNLLLRKNIAHR